MQTQYEIAALAQNAKLNRSIKIKLVLSITSIFLQQHNVSFHKSISTIRRFQSFLPALTAYGIFWRY